MLIENYLLYRTSGTMWFPLTLKVISAVRSLRDRESNIAEM